MTQQYAVNKMVITTLMNFMEFITIITVQGNNKTEFQSKLWDSADLDSR